MAEKKYKYEITDRDYFYSKFQDFLNEGELDESKGGAMWNLLADLTSALGGVQGLSDSEVKEIKTSIGNLEKVLKKTLKGKGLVGW